MSFIAISAASHSSSSTTKGTIATIQSFCGSMNIIYIFPRMLWPMCICMPYPLCSHPFGPVLILPHPSCLFIWRFLAVNSSICWFSVFDAPRSTVMLVVMDLEMIIFLDQMTTPSFPLVRTQSRSNTYRFTIDQCTTLAQTNTITRQYLSFTCNSVSGSSCSLQSVVTFAFLGNIWNRILSELRTRRYRHEQGKTCEDEIKY